MEVELRDTLRRDGLLFQSLIVRSGQGPPLPVLRLEMSAARKTGRVLICFADAGKATLADSTAWLRAQLKHYDTVLLADLRGQGETADPAAALDPKYYNYEYRPALLGLHLDLPLLTQRVIDALQLAHYASETKPGGRSVDLYAAGQSSAIVVLHVAACSGIVARVRLRALPLSWQAQLARPIARDVYSDVLPGALQHYDVPDLVRALGRQLEVEAH